MALHVTSCSSLRDEVRMTLLSLLSVTGRVLHVVRIFCVFESVCNVRHEFEVLNAQSCDTLAVALAMSILIAAKCYTNGASDYDVYRRTSSRTDSGARRAPVTSRTTNLDSYFI
eukprot:5421528-Pleurochrysis_carterae.AAC.1